MYAIIRDGSKQYRVEEGMVLDVDLKTAPAGQTVEFNEVLLLGDNSKTTVGTPTIPAAKVVAEIRGEHKGKKVEILYWRRRKSFRKHLGHRERYTRVAIKKIITGME